MAATPKPKRQEHKKMAMKEKEIRKDITPHKGTRKVLGEGLVKKAKKLGVRKSFTNFEKQVNR